MKKIKSVFIDIFKGRNYTKFNRDALQWCICFSTNANTDEIKVRSYILNDFDNGDLKQVEQPVHLTPMGFQFELVRRRRECNAKLMKDALVFVDARKRKDGESVNALKIEKGITTDEIGRKYATVHVGVGDVNKLNLRKFKGLNEKYDLSDEEGAYEEMEEFEEEDEQ